MATAVLIDGSNLHASARTLDLRIDYARFREWLYSQHHDITQLTWYTAIIRERNSEEFADGHIRKQKLFDWLAFNGYRLVTKEGKEYENEGQIRRKGNIDIEMAVDAMLLEANSRVDNMIFVTGDGDFEYLFQNLQRMGVHITLISTIETQPPMCSDTLRKTANRYIDLAQIRDRIETQPEPGKMTIIPTENN